MAVIEGTGGVPGMSFEQDLTRFMNALAEVESTNNYSALGIPTKYGRAQGRYQIMSEFWPDWAAEAGLSRDADPWDPDNQDKVAAYKLTQYWNKYKRWDLVSVAWFAGPGRADRAQVEGIDALAGINDTLSNVPDYVNKVMGQYEQFGGYEQPSRRVDRPGGTVTSDTTFSGYRSTIAGPNPYSQDPDGGGGGATAGFGSFTAQGQGGGAAADTDASGTIDDDELAAHIQRTYPQMLWALNHPEVGPVLREAAENSWDQARLYGALIKTNWWKEHPDTERVLINLRENDPATYQKMVDNQAAEMRAQAEQIGWGAIPEGRLKGLATMAMSQGWNAAQIQDQLIRATPISIEAINKGQVGGRIAEIYANLEEVANEHLITLSDKGKKKWLERILRGEVDEQAFVQHAQQVALGQYAWMADAMERGLTPGQFVEPYKDWIAQTLELPDANIDMRDRRYQDVLYDDTAGRMRTLPEVGEYVRGHFTEWRQTRQANEQAAGLNETLMKTFGKVA